MPPSTKPSLILLVLASACHVAEPGGATPEPVPLAFGLRSYLSPGQARQAISSELAWNVVENPHPARALCPRFDETHVTIPGVVANGYKGELRLDFINARLFKMLFLPEDARYFDYLRQHEFFGKPDLVAFPSRGASLMIQSPPGSKAFAMWADMKIDDQVAGWLLHCR